MNKRGAHVQRSPRMVAVLFMALVLTPGCMSPMMGMHGMHGGQDKHEKGGAASSDSQQVVATLKRVEELLSTQRVLAATLPESDEKRELVDRLDRMKGEVQQLVQSWEGQAKPVQDMGRGGH